MANNIVIEEVNHGYIVEVNNKKQVYLATQELKMFNDIAKLLTHKTLKDLEEERDR